MSEALCQCGHAQMSHFGIVGQGSCQINVGRSRCQCVKYAPPTREPIRLTDEERAQIDAVNGIVPDIYAAVECILAARLAGGPTLADAKVQWAEVATLCAHGHVICARCDMVPESWKPTL